MSMSRSKGGFGSPPATGRESFGELAVVAPDVRHTVASEHRAAICLVIEPESVRAGAFELSGEAAFGNRGSVLCATHSRRLRRAAAAATWRRHHQRRVRHHVLWRGAAGASLDPRVVRSIAQIGRFCGDPVTAASCAAEAGLSVVALPASVQAADRHLVPRVPGLEARAASAAFRQSGPQSGASGAGYRLSRLHPFQPFDPPVLWIEAARDLLRLAGISRSTAASRPRSAPDASGAGLTRDAAIARGRKKQERVRDA